MAFSLSPNMSLPIPGVGSEPGPQYATDVNNSLLTVDSHDHSPGKGVQITPAGININADLSMNNNSLTAVDQIVFNTEPPISTLQALYVNPGTETPAINDLWYNDGAGNTIQITSGGTVNASVGSLPGESFSGGTFFWKQGTGSTTPANFDIGSITIRPNVALTMNGVTLSPPGSIASQYSLFLPQIPVSTSFLTLDTSGNISGSISTTAGITGSMIANTTIPGTKLVNNTITTTQISNSANITGTQLATATVAVPNMAAPLVASTTTGSNYSNSSTTYTTIASITMTNIATTSRPLLFNFSGTSLRVGVDAGRTLTFRIQDLTNNVTLAAMIIENNSGQNPQQSVYPASALNQMVVYSGFGTATIALQSVASFTSAAVVDITAGFEMLVQQI